jgi:bifunctional oligoribonuclease and PAP phosphatase NrnA
MSIEEMLEDAAEYIRSHDDFLILTHVSPDGDALGSSLAAAHIVEKLGKTFTLVNDDPIPEKFRFLPYADRFRLPGEVERSFVHVLSFDCADRKRLGESGALIAAEATLLNVDHHATNDQFGTYNVVDIEAAATAQVVYHLASALHVEIDKDMATCLYTGLLTDTGGFRYSNTTPEIHRMAADLLSRGVEPYRVADRVLETITWPRLQLTREVLSTIERDETGRIAWLTVPYEMLKRTGAIEEDVEGLVNYARNVEGVEVGILFREIPGGKVKVSFRSKYIVDVGLIALEFGGGGHSRASGCTVESSLDEIKRQVISRVKEVLAT